MSDDVKKGLRIFCRCVCCGVAAQISNEQPIPPGWRAFSAAYWPADSEYLPCLYLRICETCWKKAEGVTTAPPAFEPPVVTPIGNLNDLLSHVCVHIDEP